MLRKGAKRSHGETAGISKPRAHDVASLDIGAIALRSSRGSADALSSKLRPRRNAVFSFAAAARASEPSPAAATASECIASSARVLSNTETTSTAAINIHVEMLAHGVALPPSSRGIALRALRRCFLFADVSVAVAARMCDVAREMCLPSGSMLQPEGSESVFAFVALDGAFSSNGSGTTAPCMLACEESFVLGHMVCSSSVALLHPCRVAIFPSHCFATCATRQGRFEGAVVSSAAAKFGWGDTMPPSRRVFLQHARGAVAVAGSAHESIQSAPPMQRCSCVCIVVVHGECVARRAASSPVTLREGAVVLSTRSCLLSSELVKVSVSFRRPPFRSAHASRAVCRSFSTPRTTAIYVSASVSMLCAAI
jgi:hypothetical protein